MQEQLADNIVLYRGDCRRLLPKLGRVVDHIICDPPYEKHMHAARPKSGARRIRTDGHAMQPALKFASVEALRPAVTPKMVHVCQGWLLVFCTPEGVAPWRDAIEAAGGRYKRACVWVKPDAAPQFNGQGPAMGAEMFVSAWCGSGVSQWNGGGRSNVFTYPVARDKLHDTEKPLALMSGLVHLFSDPGQIILDPFMGSGSTGCAAAILGRGFVGIEKDKAVFDIACRRIAAALKQADLFVPIAKPKQMAWV